MYWLQSPSSKGKAHRSAGEKNGPIYQLLFRLNISSLMLHLAEISTESNIHVVPQLEHKDRMERSHMELVIHILAALTYILKLIFKPYSSEPCECYVRIINNRTVSELNLKSLMEDRSLFKILKAMMGLFLACICVTLTYKTFIT